MPVQYDQLGNVIGNDPSFPVPNPASITIVAGYTKEVNSPKVVFAGDENSIGGPSNTPRLATGDIRKTNIDFSNRNREHVCDWVATLQKNIYLQKFIRFAANAIREGIRWLMKGLGLADRSGVFTEITNAIKALARELNYIRRTFIEPIIKFEKYVLAYITKLRALIQYILSLPERLLQAARECLEQFLRLIGSIFTDFLKELGREPILTGDGAGGFGELFSATKELLDEAGATVQAATTAVALGASIPLAATAGLLVPVSQEDLDAANNFIDTYQSQNPTVEEISGAAGLSGLREYGFPSAEETSNSATTLMRTNNFSKA